MPKKKSVSTIPQVDRASAFKSICPLQRPNILRVLEAIRELVSNAEDEGATDIRIMIDKGKRIFRIADNGRGFGRHQMDGFYWLFKSEKTGMHRKDEKPTGQHGTGRLQTLRFAKSINPVTMSLENKGVFFTTSLSRVIAEEIWGGDNTPRTWEETDKPDYWHLKPGETGSCIDIEIGDEQWSVFPDASDVADRLAQQLSPKLDQIVKVNGKKLKPRSILQAFDLVITQQEIEAELGKAAAEALGSCEIELYMPQKLGPKDLIKLGGPKNTICDLSAFTEGLPEARLSAQLPELLTSGKHLFGYFFIDGLNKYAAEDRRSLQDAVYDGFHLHLIRFLSEMVGPKIDVVYAKKEREDARLHRKERLARFSRQFTSAFDRTQSGRMPTEGDDGDLPSGKRPKKPVLDGPDFTVRPAWFHILPGETQVVNVIKHVGIEEGDLEWEVIGSGTLSREVGKQVTFTAGDLGKTKIIVRNRKSPSQTLEIPVTVVSSKTLSISPPHIPIAQGGIQHFRARNSESTSGKLTWKLSSSRGLKMSNTDGLGMTLTVADDCELGTYTLTCFDTTNPGVSAESTIEVVSGDMPSIELDGKLYYFRAAVSRQPEPVILRQDVIFTSKAGKAGTIEVDFDHPDFANLAKAGGEQDSVNLILFESIVLLHLACEHDAGRVSDVEELTSRFQEHRSRFLAKRVQ